MKGFDLTASASKVHAAGLAVCLAVAGAGYALCVRPVSAQRQTVEARQTELNAKSEQADQLGASLRSLSERVVAAEAKLEASPLKLQHANEVNKRVAMLTELAGRAKLRVDEIKPGAPNAEGQFIRVPIQLAGAGSYKACAEFLHRLRDEYPDTGVVGFELHGQPAQPDQPSAFTFDLAWFAAPGGPRETKSGGAP